jgi:hypothetical protein
MDCTGIGLSDREASGRGMPTACCAKCDWIIPAETLLGSNPGGGSISAPEACNEMTGSWGEGVFVECGVGSRARFDGNIGCRAGIEVGKLSASDGSNA